MNIPPTPPAALSGIAGTQRAAAKSATSEANAHSVSAQQRAEKPAGIESGLSQVEKDAAAGDSGADGRQMYEQRDSGQDETPQPSDKSPAQRHSVSDENTGNHLDLDG